MQKIKRIFSKICRRRSIKTGIYETEIKNIHPRKSVLDSILEANERYMKALMAGMGVDIRRDHE